MNSPPLVETAVRRADPNWGRVALAVGKCEDELDIDPDKVVIRFGEVETYPRHPPTLVLAAAEVVIPVRPRVLAPAVVVHQLTGLEVGARRRNHLADRWPVQRLAERVAGHRQVGGLTQQRGITAATLITVVRTISPMPAAYERRPAVSATAHTGLITGYGPRAD